MAQIADRRQARHACTALECVQVALQAGDQIAILWRFAQTRHQRIGMIENIRTFLGEDLEQILVHIRQFQFAVGLVIVRQRRQIRRRRPQTGLRHRGFRMFGDRCDFIDRGRMIVLEMRLFMGHRWRRLG